MNVNDIISFEEYSNLPDDIQKEKLIVYRNMFTNKQLIDAWGVNLSKLYTLINKHGLPKSPRKKNKKPKTTPANKVHKTKVDAYILEDTVKPVPAHSVTPEPVEGIGLLVKGTYNADKLIKRLEKVCLVLMDEEAEFEVELKIKEKI